MTVKPVDLEEIFTGEEYYGKYLDLHQLHEQFLNLPHVFRIDYISYLTSFYTFKDIPMETKLSPVPSLSLPSINRLIWSTSPRFWTI